MIATLFAAVFVITDASSEWRVYEEPTGQVLTVTGSGCDPVFSVSAVPGERIKSPVLLGAELIYLSSLEGLISVDMRTGDTAFSGSQTGAPWVSSEGDLWYTMGGYLYRNCEATGIQVNAFHVCVENGTAVFTDNGDNLHLLDLDTEADEMFTGYRFYAPEITPSGEVFSPTLSGEIIFIPPGGEMMVVANGEQPFWSGEHKGLFYCVSIDDGHNLTGADIWFVIPGEEPVQVTSTPDVFETKPVYQYGTLWYMDSATSLPGCVRCDDL